MGCVYFYVIILTMIGPEQRKVDHIKEVAAQMDTEIGSDGEKAHAATADRHGSADTLPTSEINDFAEKKSSE